MDQLAGNAKLLSTLGKTVQSSKRVITPTWETLFTNITRSYDAFEKDIAVLSVYFASPTAMEYTTKQSKTWLDFISAVGGNGGLCIGFSIVTLLELVWLIVRIGGLYLKP